MPPVGYLARNPDMCPDWESNWGPFGWQEDIQPTEPHQSGLPSLLVRYINPSLFKPPQSGVLLLTAEYIPVRLYKAGRIFGITITIVISVNIN